MAKEAIIDYDKENDILHIHTNQSVSDSVDFDNFVIDYSKEGMIIGVEIMKASIFIRGFGISRDFLLHAEKASLSIIQGREYALIKIAILAVGESKEITVPSPVPQLVRA